MTDLFSTQNADGQSAPAAPRSKPGRGQTEGQTLKAANSRANTSDRAERQTPDQVEREVALVLDLLLGAGVIAYQRGLARAVGDHSAGLLLSQFWHWTQRVGPDRDGWFFKSQEEIEDELVMTRREQETARRRLRELGLLEEKRVGMPARLWFRVDRLAVARMLRMSAGEAANQNGVKRQSSMAHSSTQEWTNAPNKNGAFQQTGLAHSADPDCTETPDMIGGFRPAITKKTAKITTETTAKKRTTAADPSGFAGRGSAAAADSADATGGEESADPGLVDALVEAGVNRSDARRLAAGKPDECRTQLAYLPHVAEFTSSRGAYLRTAIERGFAPPKGWQAARDAEEKRQGQQAASRSAAEAAARRAREAEESAARLAAERARLQAEDPEGWAAIVAEAERLLPPPLRGKTGHVAYGPALLGNIDRILSGGASGDREASR